MSPFRITMMALNEIAADYIRRFRKDAQERLDKFAALPTLGEAISCAALAITPDNKRKRFPHQRRIPQMALDESRSRLLASLPALAKAKSFEELHETVASLIGPIKGIGELTIYDTALCIGAKLKCEPNVVFLHAGTRDGAKLLGLDVSRKFIPITEPKLRALQKLKPREIEDALCIYKDGKANPCSIGKGCFGTVTTIHRTCAKSRADR